MEAKLITEDKKANTLLFSIKDAAPGFVNGLRRSIIDNVPVMAIDEVEFRKNNSILYDEIIAHRLGLIAFVTDLKSYIPLSECKCEGAGCARCTLKMTLSVKGPKMVLASDIETLDPKIKPIHPETPIVKLLKGQDLEFEATAKLGVGKEHAKFAPGLAWYSQMPKLTINHKNLEAAKERYPPQIFGKDGKVIKDLADQPQLVDAIVGIDDSAIKVEFEPDAYQFTIESWGQLPCREIVMTAIEQFNRKLDLLDAAVGGL